MNIYRAEPAESRKMTDIFGLKRIPADISDEEQSRIEEALIEHTWSNIEEVYIITECMNDSGEPVIFCFVKQQRIDVSGLLMLLVLGEKPQVFHIRNCYDEGEMIYGKAEISHGNVLSYYDYYIVQQVSSRHFFCFYDDNSWVKVRICSDYSREVGEPSNPSEDFDGCYIEASVNGQSILVEEDEFNPEMTPEEVKVICDRILAVEKKMQNEKIMSLKQIAFRDVSVQLSDKLEELLPDDDFGSREYAVISLRLGLDDDRPRTREEVAKEFCIPEYCVQVIEDKLRRYTESSKYYSEIDARLEGEYTKDAEIVRKYGHEEDKMSFIFDSIVKDLKGVFESNILVKNGLTPDYTLSTVTIEVSEDTMVEICPHVSNFTKADLIMDTEQTEKRLIGNVRGLATNLLHQSRSHLINKDGTIESRDLILEDPVVSMKSGSTVGSIKNNVSVSATVHQPNREFLRELLGAKLPYDISSLTFGLYLRESEEVDGRLDSWLTWMNKMRKANTVICSDSQGIKMMVAEDVYITAKFDEDTSHIYLKISTRYPSQMKYKLKDDAVVNKIIDAVLDGGRVEDNEKTNNR